MDRTLETIRHRARAIPDENDVETMKDLLRNSDNLGNVSVRKVEDFIQHLSDRWHQYRDGEENLWTLRRAYLENTEEIIQYVSYLNLAKLHLLACKNWDYLLHFYDTVLHVEFIQFNQYLGKSLDAFLRYAYDSSLSEREIERPG
jgi:hypothetical protein